MSAIADPGRSDTHLPHVLEAMAPFAMIGAVIFSLGAMLATSEVRNNRLFAASILDRAVIKAQNQRSIEDRLAMHLELRRLEARLPAAKP